MLVTVFFKHCENCKLKVEGTPRPMRTNLHHNSLKNSSHTRFPASQLTILIRIEPSSTNHLLQQKQRPKCLLPIALPITVPLQRARGILQSPNPRRTIGLRSQTLRREDAFRIELHRESSVRAPFHSENEI